MKIKQAIVSLLLLSSFFLSSCRNTTTDLQVFSFPISNGEVSVKNLTIVSSQNQIYIEDNFYFSFQDEAITNIGFDFIDKNNNSVYSSTQGVHFLMPQNEIKENKGFIIDTPYFREGDPIKINVTYFLSNEIEKSFTKNIELESEK